MNVVHPLSMETCIICLQIPQLDLISLYSYSCIEISHSQYNGNLKAEALTEEPQIAFMLTDISGYDFDSTSVEPSCGICEHCVKDLTTAYKFKKRCTTAFQQLNSIRGPKSNKAQNEDNVKGESDECFEPAILDSSFDEFEDETNNIPIEMVEIQGIDEDDNNARNELKNKNVCKYCDIVFARKYHLQRHMTIHTDERAFKCTVFGCDTSFRRADHLSNHIRARHTKNEPQNEEVAVICPEEQIANISLGEFKDETNNIHTEMVQRLDEDNTTKKKFECDCCNKVFARKTHLKRHMIVHSDERAFECTFLGCLQKFRRHDHLQNHLNIHSQIKHKCSHCQMSYSRADHLRRHIKMQHTDNELQNEESAVIGPEKQITDISLGEFKDESNKIPTEMVETQELDEDNTTKQKFECDCCNKVFVRKTHLKRHMTIHTDERAFECTVLGCLQKFRRRDHLQNHLNTHSQLKIHKCDFCENSFGRADHLRNHIRARHTEKEPPNEKDVFNCSECYRSFSSQKNLKAHARSHSIKIFNCKRCGEQFSSKIDMNKHVSEIHPNELKNHLCSECGMTFTRHDYLLIHMRRHRGEMRYFCKYCQKGFFRSTDVRVHEKYHTNEKTHSCSYCEKKFARSYNLTIHMRVHTGEKPFVCTHEKCGQAFAQSNDLKVHLRRHTGERFKCDVDTCNESFIQMYLLTRHKRDVHGIEVQSHIRRLTKFIPLPLPLESCEEAIQPDNRFLEMTQSSNYTAPPMDE